MPSQDHIDDQQKLLTTHRATLAHLLRQKAQHTEAYIPPAIEHGIHEARKEIRRIKTYLKGLGVLVEDQLNDEDILEDTLQKKHTLYASVVEDWTQRVDLDHWLDWTYWLLNAGQPSLSSDRERSLKELNIWLGSRIWPHHLAELEAAFKNFHRVLNDLLGTFHEHSERRRDGEWITVKFYKQGYGDPELEVQLKREYDTHVTLVQNLTLELTRAASYICDLVRRDVIPDFRVREGALQIRSDTAFEYFIHRPEYRLEERIECIYPGVEAFNNVVTSRDVFYSNATAPRKTSGTE